MAKAGVQLGQSRGLVQPQEIVHNYLPHCGDKLG